MARELKEIKGDAEYYALTLLGNRRGGISWSAYSHFVGWSTRQPKWQIRQASIVRPHVMASIWCNLGQGWVAVHNDRHLGVFLRIGGNALIERGLAERRLASQVAPVECVQDGPWEAGGAGFVITQDLPDEAGVRYAPTRKLRTAILKRDDYRCAMCGRRPGNHVDLELAVHHLIPWRVGGPTTESNLVTLCSTCHKGMEPDYEPKLREIAGLPGRVDPIDSDGAEYREGVQRYRQIAKRVFEEFQGRPHS
ncbi:HNH endonuclease [Microbispora rosea]|uniref:HNH endonuclease n=1 Tax=Microbispora rosea TaxID=58117 RepID=UPI0033EE37F2